MDEETPIQEDGEFPPVSGRFWVGTDGFALATEREDSNDTDILRYDLSDQTFDRLATVGGFVNALCSDGLDGLYYIADGYLWHLAAGDGAAERLLGMAEVGIELTFDNHLLTDGKGGLAVCCVNTEGAGIWLLTDEEKVTTASQETSTGQPEAVERETIRMVNLYIGTAIVETAQFWGAKSDRYQILAETEKRDTQEWEALRTRTLADLTAGKGPELMVVSTDDLRMLAEKGALMDLSELVPEDIQEQLFPGVRELGTVDGVWVGLGCHPVGFPSEKGSESYISSDNYLVVNADTSNLEAVKDCIAYLYSYDSQMQSSTVRRDVANDQIVYDPILGQVVMKIKGSQMVPDESPDGSSYKEEYLDFLESLEPKPYCPQAIKDIVQEESSQFFDGDRSAQETAEVIQRRVQLYLDEQ